MYKNMYQLIWMSSVWYNSERTQFAYCLSALRKYRSACKGQLNVLKKLGRRTQKQIEELEKGIDNNSMFFEFMAEYGPKCFGDDDEDIANMFPQINSKFDDSDLMQLDAALHSASREWTSIGSQERHEIYLPVINALNKYVNKGSPVLVPGSGLCRLAVEIAAADFSVQANESAFIMLVTAYISMFYDVKFEIAPFLHQISGLDKFEDCLISAPFPDHSDSLSDPSIELDPKTLVETGKLELKAGKFESVYAPFIPQFASIVTCFFIDVLPDVQQTIRQLYSLLNKGGVWINVGPIVNHDPNVGFFAPLTLEDVDRIAKEAGFEIAEQQRIETSYSQNPRSHVRNRYNVVLTVYRK